MLRADSRGRPCGKCGIEQLERRALLSVATAAPAPVLLAETGSGLSGTYYDNQDFTGSSVSQVDPQVNLHWDPWTRPHPLIAPENCSIVWKGEVQAMAGGPYTFHVLVDDGARLYINDTLVIDAWTYQGATLYSSPPIMMAQGEKASIRLEYFQAGGGAVVELMWSTPLMPQSLIPTSQLYPEPEAAGTGLSAVYYDNQDGSTVSRVDGQVDFDFRGDAPAPGIGVDNFGAAWQGQLKAIRSEPYIFTTLADDGLRLFLDGQLIIESTTREWNLPVSSAPIYLEAGRKYDIRVEYYDNWGGASVKLQWTSPSTPIQVVPRSQLYPTPLLPERPADPTGLTTRWSTGLGGLVELQWKDNSFNDMGYRVERSPTGEPGTFAEVGRSSIGVLVDRSVVPGQWYYYRVITGNAQGDTSYSNVASIFTGALPPVIPSIIGLPLAGSEGSDISVSASVNLAGASCDWTILKNGQPFKSGAGNTLTFRPEDDGEYKVMLTASMPDGRSGSTWGLVTVANLPPAVTLAGPLTAVRGQPVALLGGFSDPGSADAQTVAWSFGDGSAGTGLLSAMHVYAEAGDYPVTFSVTDDDGGAGQAVRMIRVKVVDIQQDAGGRAVLVVGGSQGDDHVQIDTSGTKSGLTVKLNGVVVGRYSAPAGASFSRIVIFGQAGDDRIAVAEKIAIPVEAHGGRGDDSICGGSGDDLLMGEEGDDTLDGGAGDDVLDGGTGKNKLKDDKPAKPVKKTPGQTPTWKPYER